MNNANINKLENDICTILKFLSEFPNEISSRKKTKPDPKTDEGCTEIKNIIRQAQQKKKFFRDEPTTIPDKAVSVILKERYNFPESDLERIKEEHQYSMLAENAVGELLEDYIDKLSFTNKCGWVRAYGDIIKKVDFIKFENNAWTRLQIKNRDNSENSSSQSVRDGTEIIKWHRTFSKTGTSNWKNFPDKILCKELSENGFFEHIINYFKGSD